MNRFVCASIFIILLALNPRAAHAEWVEVRSDNFTFVGDASEKKAKKIVAEIEEYRAILFNIFNIDEESETVPVRIYATKSLREITDITGQENAGGVYVPRRESPLFILNIEGGFNDKSQSKAIALHEYTHHLISRHTNQLYPRWVNEGMAEYLSTFKVSSKGKVRIGVPKDGRGRTLVSYEWMDWDIIFGAIRGYPFANDGSKNAEIGGALFYAQSWLAVHYIQSTPGLSAKLNQYIKGAPQARDPKAFFTETFGMTPDAFGAELRLYFRKNNYPGRQLTMADVTGDTQLRVRKLSKGEAAFHRGEATRQFRSYAEDGRAAALKYYDKAEASGGPMAQIEASRALIAVAAENTTDARAHIETAQSLDPTHSRILHVAAKVAMAEYEDADVPSTTEDMDSIRDQFKTALRANPENIEAHFDYVMTYAHTGDTPSKQAVQSAIDCTLHYRASDFFGDNMRIASILLNAEEYDYARYHIQRASLWSPHARARRQAREMLERLP
jgi:tetratricopeptide (TPR) repeat protein